MGTKKSMINKVRHALQKINEEELIKPSIKILAATGLSENIIMDLIKLGITYESLKNMSFSEYLSYTSGKGRESSYNRIMESYEALEEVLFPEKYELVAKEKILNIFLDSFEGNLLSKSQILQACPSLSSSDFDFFLKKGLLFSRDLCYRKKYKELSYYIEINSEHKNIDILLSRLDGRSTSELAKEKNITRQAIYNREKSILSKIPFTEEEALYKEFYEVFDCSENLFCCLFNESVHVYKFLSLRCNMGSKHLLADMKLYPFNNQQQQIIIKYYKGFLNHKNQLTTLTKLEIFNDVLFYHGRNKVNDDFIFSKFNEYIVTHNYGFELAEKPSELRGLKERSPYALQNKSHYYRYYDFNQLKEEEISHLKNLLLDLPIGIYNMAKIYLENTDFMKSIDIRNENELHNLYRTFISVNKATYNRMPEFSIGNVSKRKFIEELFFEQAPIHIDEFIDFVHEVYYLKKNSLKSFIQTELAEYISDDIIQVDYQPVTAEEKLYFKSILTSDIYTIEEVVKKGSKEIEDFTNKFINNMILNEFGYNIRGQFILTNTYKSAEKYFTEFILKNDYFINEKLPTQRTQSFWKTIYDLEKGLNLFKIEANMYITLSKLNEVGITKVHIRDFQNQVKKFVRDDEYFSLSSIKKDGFYHYLLELGFEDIFYNRILWTDPEIKSVNLANGYLFKVTSDEIVLVDFLELLIQQFEVIDSYDLIEYINEQYGVLVDLQRAISLLQNTKIYYSSDFVKFYSSKNKFFEEVYKN